MRVTSPWIEDNTPNEGSTCVKGRFGYDFPQHRDRLTRPLIRRGWEQEHGEWKWTGETPRRREGPWHTIEEMGQKLSKGLGLPSSHYHAAGADEYRGYGFPGADEMGNMFQVYRDFEKQVLGARSAETARSLNPALQSFDTFVAKNRDKILPATEPAPAPAST